MDMLILHVTKEIAALNRTEWTTMIHVADPKKFGKYRLCCCCYNPGVKSFGYVDN